MNKFQNDDRVLWRRRWMQTSAGILGAAALARAAAKRVMPTLSARSAARVIGANDRINVAIIGVGGMGGGHLRALRRQSEETGDVQVVAACDIYQRRKERARELGKLGERDVGHDYRELLERSDVDAVFIATPDHWHAQMAVDAMAAGKDVYLQKPMTLTLEEAREVAQAAGKYGRILQVGSQHLSDLRHRQAREWIEQGEIGELLWAQATASRNSLYGEWNYRIEEDASAANLDWNRWLGSAPRRPFSAERYFRWRKYWDYSGGIATDLFYHLLGPLLHDMGPHFPTRVTGCGGIYVQKDREVPDTCAILVEYPNFYINLSGSMANASAVKHFPTVIYGHKGTIVFDADQVTLLREPIFAPEQAPAAADSGTAFRPPATDLNRAHTDNFLACVRSRQEPLLHPLLGYQVMTAIKLGVDSYRLGRVMFFDPASRKVSSRAGARPAFEGDGKNHPPEPRRG